MLTGRQRQLNQLLLARGLLRETITGYAKNSVDNHFQLRNLLQPTYDNGDRHRTRKEGNVLFNDALNTFYLRLYGVRYMVKDHSDSERGNPLPPHGLLFSINSITGVGSGGGGGGAMV